MRRVAKFIDEIERPVHHKINKWLQENPEVVLVDMRPVFAGHKIVVFAVLDFPEKAASETEESK